MPVWVTTTGDRIAFFTQTTSSKARNLERDARALAIADEENAYRAAHVHGRVVETRTDAAIWHDVIHPMAVKYTGEPFPFRPETTMLCLVEVESAKVRMLPFRHPG